MAKKDAWAEGYKETQEKYLETLRKEREQAEQANKKKGGK